MKRVLSDWQLTNEMYELMDSVDGIVRSPLDSMVRDHQKADLVFPIDGYDSWQQRWLMGTGVRPPDW